MKCLRQNISVDFTAFEMDNGHNLKRCVESGVDIQWTLVNTSQMVLHHEADQMMEKCPGREMDFLSNAQYQDCPFKWFSQLHRLTFYRECLEKFDMETIKTRARAPARKLEELAFEIKRSLQQHWVPEEVTDNNKMEVGAIFGGVGLKLTTSGVYFAAIDQPLAENIDESKNQIDQMQKQYQEISTLLILYMMANEDLNDFQEKFKNLKGDLMASIDDIYVGERRKGGGAKKELLNLQNLEKLREILMPSLLSRLSASVLQSSQVWGRLAKYRWQVSLMLDEGPNKKSWGMFGAQVQKIFANGTSRNFQVTNLALDSAAKILEIASGSDKILRTLHHDIILTSRKIGSEMDRLYDAYTEILGLNKLALQTGSQKTQRQIYSIHVQVTNANWDYLSGAYLMLQDHERQCKTSSHSFYSGWTTLSTSRDLAECQFMEFNVTTLRVVVVADSTMGDAVTITTIQVSTDGNFLPSLSTHFNQSVTISGSRKSKSFPFVELRGLKAIKVHTSNEDYSGTDNDVEFQLKYEKYPPTDTVRLDNFGNDRVPGNTDIYRGESIKSINNDIRDYLEYFPDNGEIAAYVKLIKWGLHEDDWNPDLLKLYFAGEKNMDVAVSCQLQGKWVSSEKPLEVICKKRKVKNPEKSLQMIEAHSCDIADAESDSDQIRLNICKKSESLKKLATNPLYTGDGECCRTNLFQITGGRGARSKIDIVDGGDTLYDGGEALGECEGFEMSRSQVFIGKYKIHRYK